jgi:hypothetical protein
MHFLEMRFKMHFNNSFLNLFLNCLRKKLHMPNSILELFFLIFLYLKYETNLIAFLKKIKKFIHACLQYFYFNKSNFLNSNYNYFKNKIYC